MFFRLKLNFLIIFGMVLTIPGIAFSQEQNLECSEDPPESIQVITSVTRACFQNFDSPGESYTLEVINDRQICECLKSDPLLGDNFKEAMSRAPQNAVHDSLSSRNRRIMNENKRLAGLRNGLYFQAGILSDSSDESTRIIQMYSQNYLPPERLSEAQTRLDALTASSGQPLATERISVPEFNPDLLNSNGSQCISAREVIAFRQLPSDNRFYDDLAQTTTFVPQEWNYESLRNEYARLMGSTGDIIKLETNASDLTPDQVKARSLYLRLRFLNRNPLYRALFSTTGSGSDEGLITEAQQKLFNSIKTNLSPSSDCSAVPFSCAREVALSPSVAKLRTDALAIFRDPALAQLITNHSLNEWNNRINELPENLSFNDNNGREALMLASGMTSETSGNVNCQQRVEYCYEGFKQYCPALETQKRNQAEFGRSNPGLLQILNFERRTANDFNTVNSENVGEDSELNGLVSNICEADRYSTGTPQTSSNFNSFIQAHCSSNPTDPVCVNPSDDRARLKLVSDFIRVYPSSYRSEMEVAAEDDGDRTILETFAAVASIAPITSIVNNEVQAIRQSNQTVEEHRSFMGGVGTLFRSTGGLVGDIGRGTVGAISSGATAIRRAASTVVSAAPPATASIFPAVAAIAPAIAQAVTQAAQAPIPERVVSESRNQTPTLSHIERDTLAQELENLRRLNSDRASSSSPENNSFYEQRIRSLEGQLARVDATNTLAARNLAQATEAQRSPAAVSRDGSFEGVSAGSAAGAGARIVGGGSVAGATSGGPGQMASSFTEASTINAQVKGDSNINRALLAAHDSRASADVRGSIIVVQEKNPGEIEQINQASAGSTLPLNVSADIYSAFESRDPETLERYQQAILGVTGSVVKISVDSPGRQTIVMYAIKQNDGRVVFQPIRKSTLKDLQNSIQI